MAYMYPPTLADDHAAAAERLVFDLLATQLGEEFFCYHSLPTLTPGPRGAREGEVDFVVLHRKLGLLALEVKGGGFWRDGQGRWFRQGRAGARESLARDPFAQARDHLHALVDLLQQRLGTVLPEWGGKLALPFGHALLLPEVTLPRGGPLPEGVTPELLLDARALGALEAHLRRAMACWAGDRPPVPAREFKRFRNHVLHPALALVPTLAGCVRGEQTAFVRMTDEQLRLLDMAAALPRVLVRGAAGTGKTVLAIEKAARLAREGKRTGLLCFNRPLAGRIRQLLDGQGWEGARDGDGDGGDDTCADGPAVQVGTYHALCRHAARLLGRPFDVPAAAEQPEFWQRTAPEFLLEAVASGKLGFDALVVDEAQDLESEWWVTIEALVPPGGTLWVFSDPHQDIYNRSARMPSGLAPLLLSVNCRATRKLRELCDRLAGVTTVSSAFTPQGEPHEEIACAGPADVRAKLGTKLEELLHQGLDPAQLAVLTPHRLEHSSLAGVTQLAGLPLVAAPEQRGLLVSTARRFKGLEADVVLLIDQDPADPACDRVHRYVAASRARHRLIVFGKGAWDLPGG